jgi:hypothetical protein
MEQKEADRCEYCGHVRCAKCEPARWPNLADGCCACRRRVLSQLSAASECQCREAPRLYGPGAAVSQTCRSPFWGITLRVSSPAWERPAESQILVAGLVSVKERNVVQRGPCGRLA